MAVCDHTGEDELAGGDPHVEAEEAEIEAEMDLAEGGSAQR